MDPGSTPLPGDRSPAARLIAAALRGPRRTLALLLALVAVAAPGVLWLELQTDGRLLVPQDDPAVQVDREVEAHFGLRQPVVVLLDTKRADGIFDTAFLRGVSDLTAALQRLPQIGEDHVISLATEPSDRFANNSFTPRRLLDPLPSTADELARLRRDLDSIGILDGTLVAADRSAATVLVGMPPALDRTALVQAIGSVARGFESAGAAVHVVGAPVAEALLGLHILHDLAFLVPLSVALIAGVVFVFCRRLAAVAMAMAKVGACLVFVAGVMGLSGSPVYLTTAILPVILLTLGLADEIHVLAHYQRLLAGAGDALPRCMREMRRAVVLTSTTTAVGFASFLTSDLAPVRSLGIFAPLGILFCLLWTLTATPAALRLLPSHALARSEAAIAKRQARSLGFAAAVRAHRLPVRLVLLAVTLMLGAGCLRLIVQDSWIEGFAAGSRFRTSTELVDDKLFGTHTLLLQLTATPPPGEPVPRGLVHSGPLLDPTRIAAIEGLERFARAQPEIGGVLGLYSQLAALSYLTKRREGRTVEPTVEEIERLVRLFGTARGDLRRREMLDDGMQRTLVTCLLKDANYRDTARVMAALREYAERELAPRSLSLAFAGDIAVSQAMIPAIVRTQLGSLLLTLALNFGVLWVALRGAGAAALCSLPSALGVLWVFGAMGYLGIPLGVATSMFCAISLGIGIDYAVHLRARVVAAAALGDAEPAVRGLAESAPAIAADTVAIAAGFSLLALSQVPANARLGLLVALALVAACVLALVGLGGGCGLGGGWGRRRQPYAGA